LQVGGDGAFKGVPFYAESGFWFNDGLASSTFTTGAEGDTQQHGALGDGQF